ncbi:MAG: trehalose-phosphatase, partial [Burkholderiaceae bacterium]
EPPPQAERSARDLVREHTELIFEPKPSGFALHYRARPDLEALCRDTLAQALAASPDASSAPSGAARGWTLQQGHCVIEVKQAAVSKGTALQAFLSEAPFAGRVPVFVGDDVTDEDGIRVAQAAGGFGVRVGDGASQAHHRLSDTDAVARWLTGAAQAAAPHAEGAR